MACTSNSDQLLELLIFLSTISLKLKESDAIEMRLITSFLKNKMFKQKFSTIYKHLRKIQPFHTSKCPNVTAEALYRSSEIH